MKRIIFLSTILLVLNLYFIQCSNGNSNKSLLSQNDKYMTDENLEANEYEQIWKEDSCGCLKKRTPEIAERIILDFDLLGKDTTTFLNHFGPYNEKYVVKKGTVFIYYLTAGCLNGKLDEQADKSWIIFVFDKDAVLKEIPNTIGVE